jgi:catechol 2,3-dioxygenase-like lactoylglutathione lyase family enzyme
VSERAKLVGVNHVALEVGDDLDEALAFYGRIFDFELRGRAGDRMAFLDMGDQFLAISAGRSQPADDDRHFGLVVDDMERVRESLEREGIEILPGRGLDFRDPWGNRLQIVQYSEIQFERTAGVKRKLGIEDAEKSASALEEIADRGLE